MKRIIQIAYCNHLINHKSKKRNDRRNKKKWRNNLGRKPVLDKAIHRYSVSFNDKEHSEFLSRFEESGISVKAHFIKYCVLDKPIKVMKIDKAEMDFVKKLTEFYAQFRNIGINYNQVVLTLKSNFSEKKALACLYKLEKLTIQFATLSKEIIDLIKHFEKRWLQK